MTEVVTEPVSELGRVDKGRMEDLLADAAELFETYLWEADSCRAARDTLAGYGLDEKVIRAFSVGYAPVGPDQLMNYLGGLGYSTEEIVTAGLANRSPRGRAHAHFRSRLMFPVRDRDGQTIGFAGLGTHLGPSWALWVTSPETDLYRRSHAVFGLDRAARAIAVSGTAVVRSDCIEVLRAHRDGQRNAIAVHSDTVTRTQMLELAARTRGGIDALELDLPPGVKAESEREPTAPKAGAEPVQEPTESTDAQPRHLRLKRIGVVAATALAAINAWTGAPLLAVWVGSQVQTGRLVSMQGVVTVVAVLAALMFLLGLSLTWLSAKYDQLTGRPRLAGQTSPWHRAKRGDRVEDVRSRYGMSAPEKVVAASVVAAVIVFELWFFFLAGSSLGNA